MRFGIVCAALCCWASVAVAQVSFVSNESGQVSFVRTERQDDQVAAALGQLIGEKVVIVDAAIGGTEHRSRATSAARVSIDRKRSTLHVVTRDRPAGLTRVLDDDLLTDSPYAVALAAAELLDLLHVTAARARATPSYRESAPHHVAAPELVAPTASEAQPFRDAAPEATEVSRVTAEQVRAGIERRTADERRAESEAPAPVVRTEAADSTRASEAASSETIDSGEIHPPATAGNAARSSLPDYALGADLELQSQPGHELSFVRPALYGELAWGREKTGLFWTAGARVSAPLGRELQPSAAGPAEGSRVRAQALDAALQLGTGYSLGRLGVAAHVAAGLTYLRVEALDADRHTLGHEAQVSPLLAAGLGARLSVALGFALALRAEAQWAGPATVYRIGGERVLEGGPFRLGVLAGVLWESAFGRAAL